MVNGRQLINAGNSRRALDFYPTPPEVTVALMDFLKLNKTLDIIEPACGDKAMSTVLENYGHTVISSDIRTGTDYLLTPMSGDAIITNPPFCLSQQFIEKAISEAGVVAMLLKSQYWHARARLELFKKFPPAWILPLTWRPDFLFNTRKPGERANPTMEVAWTVWIKGDEETKYKPLMKPDLKNIKNSYMPKTKVPAKAIKPVKPKTVAEEITEIFNQYLDTTSAIITDYVPDPGMLVELAAADKNFKEEIGALEEEMEIREVPFKELLEKMENHDDFDSNAVLEFCDMDDAAKWLSSEGYAVIKIDNMQQRSKLEDFVRAEIWPFENDKSNYNI